MIIVDANTVSVVATFTEPSQQSDGSPLTNLAFCSVVDMTDNITTKVTASSPNGGGKMSVTIPLTAADGTSKVFSFEMNATDLKGSTSKFSAVVPFTVNRLAPMAPSSFTIA
jgi:hypothetical protein